jgi:hypothetical protein
MSLESVLAEVHIEHATKGEKKHYIPFDKDEFEKLRVTFKKPNLMPNDIKLILLAICDDKFTITLHPKEVAKRKAIEDAIEAAKK